MYIAYLGELQLTPTFKRIGYLLGTLSLTACVGGAPDDGEQNSGADAGAEVADANPDPGTDANDEVTPAELKVSGKVIDYFGANIGTPNAIVANATLSTDGLSPAIASVVDGLGAFSIDVLPASLFYVNVTAPGYAYSKNPPTQLLDVALVHDQYAASSEGIARQYSGAGDVLQVVGNGIIMVDLVRNDGTPAIDIPLTDITIASTAAPAIALGNAYLVSAESTDLSPMDVTLVSAVDATGRARAGFLNIGPGDYTVSVTVPGAAGGLQVTQATVTANGATFVNSASAAVALAGNPGAIVLDPDGPLGFSEDIYPLLMTVAGGGDGCATCHNAAHVLPFVGTPDATLALLLADALDPAGVPRIDLVVPMNSPFVMNPVFEAIPNHPNAFWTVNSNHYQAILAWITQGAALLRADAVLPIEPT